MMNMNMDKKSLMKIITQASFALDDTRLFLDTHPNCQEAILYYNKMQEMRKAAWKEYTRRLDPLTFYEVSNEYYWELNKGPMPWEGGNC